MKLRNTTDFDSQALRSLLRRVVREVERTLVSLAGREEHPLGWTADNVHVRATLILDRCDVWIRQRRTDREASRLHAIEGWQRRAEQAATDHERERASVHVERWTLDGGTGRARYSGTKLRLTLYGPSVAAFLWLARHEVWHLFGLPHEHFPAAIMHETVGARVAVCELFGVTEHDVLPLAVVKPKQLPNVETRAANKLAALEERTRRWTTKLKRAQTALTKLKRQRSYYERQLAQAANRQPKEPV